MSETASHGPKPRPQALLAIATLTSAPERRLARKPNVSSKANVILSPEAPAGVNAGAVLTRCETNFYTVQVLDKLRVYYLAGKDEEAGSELVHLLYAGATNTDTFYSPPDPATYDASRDALSGRSPACTCDFS